jgi:hypothetical protein
MKGVAGKHDDQLGRQDDADKRADGRIFERTGLHLGEVDVEHHDDEQEQHRHRADIDHQQDHRQEFSAREQEQPGRVEEGEDQEQHRMHRIARCNHHEGGSHCHEGKQIEKQSRQTHDRRLFVFPPSDRNVSRPEWRPEAGPCPPYVNSGRRAPMVRRSVSYL